MSKESWTSPALVNRFVDDAYATVKGYVRNYVMHRQLLDHLPAAPASVLDVGAVRATSPSPWPRQAMR